MMVGSSDLLARAAKEVQIADHLLTVTYPFAGELKILFRVMQHTCDAVLDARRAVGEDAMFEIPSGSEALAVLHEFQRLLAKHETAPMVFMRRDSYVMASDQFDSIDEIRADTVSRKLKMVKEFVFQAGKHLVVVL